MAVTGCEKTLKSQNLGATKQKKKKNLFVKGKLAHYDDDDDDDDDDDQDDEEQQ